MRHSIHNSHAWTSQSPPTPFCPALQAVSGSFLLLNQCQGARHEHRMQILLHPGPMWNNLDFHLNSTLTCFLKQAERHSQTHVAKCTLNKPVEWTGYAFKLLKFEKESTLFSKKIPNKVLQLPEDFHSWSEQVLGYDGERGGLSWSPSCSN